MTEEQEIWRAFARVVEASGGPKFAPPDGALIDALRDKFECPGWFVDLIHIGYPTSAIKLGHMTFFPPLAEFIEFRNEDPAWPREWLPIEFSDGHRIHFLRSELPVESGLWTYFRDGGEPDGVHAAPGDPEWKDFEDFIASLGALFAEARESSFVSREGARWLRPDAIARVEERLGKHRAHKSFDFFGVTTPDDVRAQWDSDRRTALYAMMLTGLFTAFAAVFVFMPGGRGWAFALVVGVLPTALLIYCSRAWRRSIARLRSLQSS